MLKNDKTTVGQRAAGVMENRYVFYDIIRDCEGDLVGDILFNYNNDTYRHEFTFNVKENTLISIDYGFKIPFIKEVWEEIENYLKTSNRTIK